MDRQTTRPPTRPTHPQVLLERVLLGEAPTAALFEEHARRAEDARRWRNDVAVKVRDGRFGELTPVDRGLIMEALASGV